MDTRWTPLKQVGPFKFGSTLKEYSDTFSFREDENKYRTPEDWKAYIIDGENDNLAIYVEDGEIVSIRSEKELYYKDYNLIGLRIDAFIKLVESAPSEIDKDFELPSSIQDVYEFDDLEAQVWVLDGVVVTIFLG